MDTNIGGIARLFLIAPAIHLSLCYYYLFLRSAGFGSGLSEFVAVGDVFTVGLGKLISTYIFFAVGTVIGYVWVEKDPLQVSGKTEIEIHPSLERPSVRFMFLAIPYVTAASILLSLVVHKWIFLSLIPFVFLIPLAKLSGRLSAKNNYSFVVSGALIMVPLALMNLTASAYSDGFRLRHKPFEYFRANSARCEDGTAILFSAGDRFIGVERSGRRVLLTNECKRVLNFPSSKVLIDVV